jgi:hypothetical protein
VERYGPRYHKDNVPKVAEKLASEFPLLRIFPLSKIKSETFEAFHGIRESDRTGEYFFTSKRSRRDDEVANGNVVALLWVMIGPLRKATGIDEMVKFLGSLPIWGYLISERIEWRRNKGGEA